MCIWRRRYEERETEGCLYRALSSTTVVRYRWLIINADGMHAYQVSSFLPLVLKHVRTANNGLGVYQGKPAHCK